jgi:hypothetical protein
MNKRQGRRKWSIDLMDKGKRASGQGIQGSQGIEGHAGGKTRIEEKRDSGRGDMPLSE